MTFPEAAEATDSAGAADAAGPPPESPPQPDSLGQVARVLLSVLRELPKLVNDRVELLSLDLQRAGSALGQIIGLIVVLTILGLTAWLLIWAGLLLALVMAGLPRWGAVLVAVAVNGLGLWWAVARIRTLVPRLSLPAFRRHLTLTPLPEAPVPEGAPSEESPTP